MSNFIIKSGLQNYKFTYEHFVKFCFSNKKTKEIMKISVYLAIQWFILARDLNVPINRSIQRRRVMFLLQNSGTGRLSDWKCKNNFVFCCRKRVN